MRKPKPREGMFFSSSNHSPLLLLHLVGWREEIHIHGPSTFFYVIHFNPHIYLYYSSFNLEQNHVVAPTEIQPENVEIRGRV